MEYCRSLYSKWLVRPMKYSRADMGCLGLRLSPHPCGLWYGLRLALCRTEHYLPLQREQRAALSIVCDDERLLSSPTFPLLFIAGLTGGCPQEPAPCLRLPALDPTPAGGDGSAACWMEEVLQQSTPAFSHQKHPVGLQPSLLATNFSLTLQGIVFRVVEGGQKQCCRRDVGRKKRR